MINRYQTKELKQIWSEEEKYKNWLNIEIAYLNSYICFYNMPDKDIINRLKLVAKNIDWSRFIKKINIYEEKTRHDVIGFLYALKDEIKEDARLIHIGL